MKTITVNVATGEQVEGVLSADEILERETQAAQFEAIDQARADARDSAIAKLEALGLTVDEVSAAFGLEA